MFLCMYVAGTLCLRNCFFFSSHVAACLRLLQLLILTYYIYFRKPNQGQGLKITHG